MKRIALALAAQLCGSSLVPAHAQTPDSLPRGWERRGPILVGATYVIAPDREVRHGGATSLRIRSVDAGPNDNVVAAQRFLSDEYRGRRVRLAGFARVADVTASAGFILRVDGGGSGTPFDNMRDRPVRGTADWQRLELVLDVPADGLRIYLAGWLRGPGTLWIDDLELSVVDSSVPTTGTVLPPQNPAAPPDLPRTPRNLDFEDREIVVRPPPLAYDRREAMIPMRDGVRLHTVIAAPRAAAAALPILLVRSPYGTNYAMDQELAADRYIFVTQDIRGRYGSEGTFVMNRPARDPRDPSAVDETSDAWDTVDWLVRNVPDNNGRVGVHGVSYPGWLAEVVLLDPHPAVKAVSPQAPMTDTWLGDDFFHQGAFRQQYGFGYAWGLEREMAGAGSFPNQGTDLYEWFLSFGSLKALTDSTGALRLPTWRRFVEHPAYDREWQGRAFQRLVTRLGVPTLSVGGWWDQEDLFGPQATYAALERLDTAGVNHLVVGPWFHTQWAALGGTALGNLRFGQATSDSFLLNLQAPWWAYWLKGRGDGRFPEAWLFDAGTNRWRSFDRWPPRDAGVRGLYFHGNGRLSFDRPAARAGFDQYVSDPASPVPYVPRPVTYQGWYRWMTEDQRFVRGRHDVLSWQTEPLAEDVTIAGDVTARLLASTTGSDADWVVKLIDVYPDSVPGRPEMAGYQLMVAGDILRGRYRRSWEHPEPVRPNAVESYTVDLHQQYYTFRRGHRIMVQVQSTWFPLYDRNPQTWVPNIFEAPASAYRAQTHRIYRTARYPTRVEVMVLTPGDGSP